MGLTFTMEEEKDLTIPEDTIVRARLEEIKQHDFTWTDHKKSPPEEVNSSVLQWWWLVMEGEYTGRRVKGECPVKLAKTDRSRFRQWAEALLERDIPIGMPIDTDDLIGLTADISVRHDVDKKDPSKKYERVDEVISVHAGSDANSWDSAPPF